MSQKSSLLVALEQPAFRHKSDGALSKIKIKRFCIDNAVENEAYEALLDRMLAGEIKILKEEEVYSQKSDAYYVVVKWGERI